MTQARRWVRRHAAWVQIGAIAGLFLAWTFASPLGSVPDEPAHVVKAASIWQGELRGETVALDPADSSLDVTAEMLKTPESYAEIGLLTCTAFKPEVRAGCGHALSHDDHVMQIRSAAGPYPPLFYALVGWPSRILPSASGVYLMRIASAAVCTALAALALGTLRRRVGPRLAFVAVTLAITPEVAFLAGSVNPNGLEVLGALACWAGFASIADALAADECVSRLDLVTTLTGTAGLALTRSLGPLLTIAVVGVVLISHGRGARALLGKRPMPRVLTGIGAIAVLGAAWVVTSGHLSAVPGEAVQPGRSVLLQLVGRIDDWIRQMIAVFGWLETGPVRSAVWAWLIALGAMMLMVLKFGRGWRARSPLLLMVAVAFAPVIIQYPGAASQGIAWQGRYGLALAVGLPVMAALALGRIPLSAAWQHRLLAGIAVLALTGQTTSFFTALHRYAVGASGRLVFWSAPKAWSPPVGSIPVMALFVASMTALVIAAMSTTSETQRP